MAQRKVDIGSGRVFCIVVVAPGGEEVSMACAAAVVARCNFVNFAFTFLEQSTLNPLPSILVQSLTH